MQIKSFTVGQLGTNCYVVYNQENKKAIVVDMAYGEQINKVIDFIKTNSLSLEAVLLTHGHFDHVGGVKILTDTIKCPVYIHEADAEMAKNAGHNKYGAISDNAPITNIIFDDCTLDINGISVKVICTPGHTMGSVCYIIENFMLSGDTLFNRSIGRTDLDGSNATKMKESLRKLSAIDVDYEVFPGHMDTTTLFEEKQYNFFLTRV